jgi:hypothetical protein
MAVEQGLTKTTGLAARNGRLRFENKSSGRVIRIGFELFR